jgi:hypothetical protein
MNFSEFYKIVNEQVKSQPGSPRPVDFEFFRSLVTQDKSLVEKLDIWRVTYDTPIREARFTLFDERESMHDDPVYFAEICFCASLEADPKQLLYALTKELMHVFDPMDTWINTRDKFISFLKDLQNSPLNMANGSIGVEHKAKWMAMLTLCPEAVRSYIIDSVSNKKALKGEISQELGLPSALIDIALDEYYLEALRILT